MFKKITDFFLCWYYYLKIRWIHYPRLKKIEEEENTHYEYHYDKFCYCDVCKSKRIGL